MVGAARERPKYLKWKRVQSEDNIPDGDGLDSVQQSKSLPMLSRSQKGDGGFDFQ